MSLDALTRGLFDYAGMFPPASLGLPDALKNSAGFPRSLSRPGLLAADLVLPYTDLPKLSKDALAEAGWDRLIRVCVLGAPLGSPSRAAELAFLKNLCGARPDLKIVSYELKAPAGRIDGARKEIAESYDRLAPLGVRLFVEPDAPSDTIAAEATMLLGELDAADMTHPRRVGLKLRGSGPTAVDNAALAVLLEDIVMRSLPFKATAGLHHPLIESRRYDNALGFMGLVTALRLTQVLGAEEFDSQARLACLSELEPAAFEFDGGAAWRQFRADLPELEEAMAALPFTIGSCSLSEPDGDLVRLFPEAPCPARP